MPGHVLPQHDLSGAEGPGQQRRGQVGAAAAERRDRAVRPLADEARARPARRAGPRGARRTAPGYAARSPADRAPRRRAGRRCRTTSTRIDERGLDGPRRPARPARIAADSRSPRETSVSAGARREVAEHADGRAAGRGTRCTAAFTVASSARRAGPRGTSVVDDAGDGARAASPPRGPARASSPGSACRAPLEQLVGDAGQGRADDHQRTGVRRRRGRRRVRNAAASASEAPPNFQTCRRRARRGASPGRHQAEASAALVSASVDHAAHGVVVVRQLDGRVRVAPRPWPSCAHVIRDLEVGELQASRRRDDDRRGRPGRCRRARRSFSSAASATPVCGQLNMPVRSARAAASASSSSVACSTTPSYRWSVRDRLADRHRVADADGGRERRPGRDRLELPTLFRYAR